MKRREFFKFAGLGTFALTIHPMKLLAEKASVSFGHTPGGVKEVAIPIDPPQAPEYWITTFRDPGTSSIVRRAHCTWRGEEYGIERHIPECQIESFIGDLADLVQYTDELLVAALTKAIVKVGGPKLNKCTEVRAWEFKGRSKDGGWMYEAGGR